MVLFPEGKPVKKETFEEYRSSGGYNAVASHHTPAEILDEFFSGFYGAAAQPMRKYWNACLNR